MRLSAGLVLGVLALSGCGSLTGYVSPQFAGERRPAVGRVLVMTPEVEFYEVSAGGVPEKVYAWQEQAKKSVRDAVLAVGREHGLDQTIEAPPLSGDERLRVELHQALFRRIAEQIETMKDEHDASWKAVEPRLEFSIGGDLAEFGKRVGADSLLFIDGVDVISNPERRFALILTTLLFGLPVLGPGSSYLQIGLVELASGRVLWLGRDYTLGSSDLRDPEAARQLVAMIFKSWPGAAAKAAK